MVQQVMVFRGGKWEAHPRALDGVCKDVLTLLQNQEGKLSFLLKNILYVALGCFEVKF